MKKSIIKDIFNGIRGHQESMDVPDEVMRELEKVNSTYDELQKKLSPELLSLLENYTDATLSHLCEDIDFYFAEGFKLGLRIGIECME